MVLMDDTIFSATDDNRSLVDMANVEKIVEIKINNKIKTLNGFSRVRYNR